MWLHLGGPPWLGAVRTSLPTSGQWLCFPSSSRIYPRPSECGAGQQPLRIPSPVRSLHTLVPVTPSVPSAGKAAARFRFCVHLPLSWQCRRWPLCLSPALSFGARQSPPSESGWSCPVIGGAARPVAQSGWRQAAQTRTVVSEPARPRGALLSPDVPTGLSQVRVLCARPPSTGPSASGSFLSRAQRAAASGSKCQPAAGCGVVAKALAGGAAHGSVKPRPWENQTSKNWLKLLCGLSFTLCCVFGRGGSVTLNGNS